MVPQGGKLPCRGHSNPQVRPRGRWCPDLQQSTLGWTWWSSRSRTRQRCSASGYTSHELQCSLATCEEMQCLFKWWQSLTLRHREAVSERFCFCKWTDNWKDVRREPYLLEKPFVQRPLARVQYAPPRFIQRFRHVHVALKTICGVTISRVRLRAHCWYCGLETQVNFPTVRPLFMCLPSPNKVQFI